MTIKIKKAVFLTVLLAATLPSYASSTLVETNASNTPLLANHNAHLVDSLQQKGVQVQVTDTVKIILRVDSLFRLPSSTQLRDATGGDILAKISQLIQSYGNRIVTVSGHTDNVGTDQAKLKRSHDQAETIAAYLWSHGIPLQHLLVIGYSDTKPVATNKTEQGSAENRRIEIELQ
jgi:outer membrane protein OmpA-like peptidoglycan-associated protein